MIYWLEFLEIPEFSIILGIILVKNPLNKKYLLRYVNKYFLYFGWKIKCLYFFNSYHFYITIEISGYLCWSVVACAKKLQIKFVIIMSMKINLLHFMNSCYFLWSTRMMKNFSTVFNFSLITIYFFLYTYTEQVDYVQKFKDNILYRVESEIFVDWQTDGPNRDLCFTTSREVIHQEEAKSWERYLFQNNTASQRES